MIVGGIDVSGNSKDGNHKFMGIVVGTTEKIDSIIKHIGYEKLAPSQYKPNRKIFSSRLRFDDDECIAFCIRIEKKAILDNFKKAVRKRHSQISMGKIIYSCDYLILRQLREKLTEFTNRQRIPLSDVPFQCDSDCKNFIKINGLHPVEPKNAYILSDLVAWSNNRGKEPGGVIFMDLRNVLEEELGRSFK